MTHEEIIAMAREEGLSFVPDTNSPLVRIVRKAVAKERDACAEIAEKEDVASTDDPFGVQSCIAAAIRARGQKDAA